MRKIFMGLFVLDIFGITDNLKNTLHKGKKGHSVNNIKLAN